MTIETGALEQAYAKVETSYLVTPADALSATDAIRHLDLSIETKKNREASPEKRGTPDESQSLPRRQTTTFNLASIMWEPSGTLGTASNIAKFLKAGFGSSHVIAAGLDTTVEAAPVPTATGCTLTSATGLAVGDMIAIKVGGAFQATRIKTLATAAITYDALSAAPDVPGKVLAGVTFALASNITESLAFYKYYNGGGFKQAAYGSVIDKIEATFDGTREVLLAFSGPAGDYADSTYGTVQSKPASHTTVGAPASGMVGSFFVDGTAFLVTSAKFSLDNGLELRNKELGTAKATGIAGRANLRKIKVSLSCYLEDLTLLTKANAVTTGVLRLLIGSTKGSIVAALAPKVEFEIPSVGSETGPKDITFEGVCYATNGNDQLFFAEL